MLSPSGYSQLFLPHHRENTFGKLPLPILVLSRVRARRIPAAAGRGSLLGLPKPVSSPSSLGRSPVFPAGLLLPVQSEQEQLFLDRNNLLSAVLLRMLLPHVALPQACFQYICSCGSQHPAVSTALCQGLCVTGSPRVSTSCSSQIFPSCHVWTLSRQTVVISFLSATGAFHLPFACLLSLRA